MEKVYDRCCGIDAHKKRIVAYFKDGNKQERREFGTTTRELLEIVFKDLGDDYYNQFKPFDTRIAASQNNEPHTLHQLLKFI